MYAKALCNGDRRPNNHVIPSRGIITTHAFMPSLKELTTTNYPVERFRTPPMFYNIKSQLSLRTDNANFGPSRIYALIFCVEDNYPIT